MPRGNLNPTRSAIPVPNELAPAVKLSGMEWRFVENFLLTASPFTAARDAGYSNPNFGYKVIKRPNVQAAIEQAVAFRSARTARRIDQVVYRWAMIAEADVNELVSARVFNCRFCWGDDGRYQYTPEEWRRARQKHYFAQLKKNPKERREFDDEGGYGFQVDRAPNPECTECRGLGVLRVVPKDTENLSPQARLIYDGVKVSKDGTIEYKVRSRDHAEAMLAKHLGMFREREPVREFDPSRMGEDELDAVMDNLPPSLRDQVQALFESMVADQGMAREAGLADITSYQEPPRRRQRVIIEDD